MSDSANVHLAIDLGASGGRVIAGEFDGQRLSLEVVHRFANGGVAVGDRLYWDVLGLWSQIQDGLAVAGRRYGERVRSLGVDTWGVDFGLLGPGDELLGNPYHYRDRRTEGILERAFERVPRDEIFAASGLQFMPFNTLYQLWAMRTSQSPLLDQAESLLMMPDLFHWMLTGEKCNEYTNATTTQCYAASDGDWAWELLRRFDLPRHLFRPVTAPGSVLGPLRPGVREATGLGCQVIAPGTHDTASAVMAVPTASPPSPRPDWCYISSGTWSLMGVEVDGPIINETCSRLNFTNEGGVGGTIRVLKNIAGLWLLQCCRQVWLAAGREFDWPELLRLAEAADPLVSLIDPDDPRFVAPDDMVAAIRGYCGETGQVVPASEGAVVRCALESLALRYRWVLQALEQLTGGPIRTVHIVGGGTQNRLLCQMTADACGRRVVAGPVEATAIGNAMLQAVACGGVSTIAEARQVIRGSFDVDEYTPRDPAPWEDAYQRFLHLAGG